MIQTTNPHFRPMVQIELLALISFSLIAFAATTAPAEDLLHTPRSLAELPHFQSSTNLALLRFHVVKKGLYVENLVPEDVQVLEDGTPREIVFFQGPQTASRRIPVELVLLIDRNGSAAGMFTPEMFSSKAFALPDQLAAISIFAFGDKLISCGAPTRDPRMLGQAILEFNRSPNSRARLLYGAIAETCRRSVETSDREVLRSVVIFSNGSDIGAIVKDKYAIPEANEKDALSEAIQRNITLYPVLLTGLGPGNDVTDIYQKQFADLGAASGGRSYAPIARMASAMLSVLMNVAADLQYEYVVGYHPTSLQAPGRHRARIELRDKSRGDLRGGDKNISR